MGRALPEPLLAYNTARKSDRFGVGFFLAPSGSAASAPVCIDGRWIENY